MKERVAKKHPNCLKSLENAIKVVWTIEISSDFCKRLTASMPRQGKQLLKIVEDTQKMTVLLENSVCNKKITCIYLLSVLNPQID